MVKTNLDLIKVLDQMDKAKTVYVMGCFGAPMRDDLKDRYINGDEYNRRPDRRQRIENAPADWFGFDCVCMIKGALWGWNGDKDDIYGGADYRTDICPDIGADSMINACKSVSTNFNAIEVGEAVWIPGHIGIYMGDGMCIECTPIWEDGVQYTVCANISSKEGNRRRWEKHGKLPWITYVDTEKPKPVPPAPKPMPDPVYAKLAEMPGYLQDGVRPYVEDGSLKGYGDERGIDLTLREARLLTVVHRHMEKMKKG